MKKRSVFIDVEMLLTLAGIMRNRRGDMMSKIQKYIGQTAADILKATGQENTIPVNLGAVLTRPPSRGQRKNIKIFHSTAGMLYCGNWKFG